MALRYDELVFADQLDRRELARSEKAGRLVRLAPGVYSGDTKTPREDIVRRRLWAIVAHRPAVSGQTSV